MDETAGSILQQACRQSPSDVLEDDLYHRRNKILKQLVACRWWPTERDKYEVLGLVMKYWMHGSQIGLPTSLPYSQNVEAQPSVAGTFDRNGHCVESPVMCTLLQEILTRLPEDVLVQEMSSSETGESLGLCETCEEAPAFQGTFPECISCYQEH